jgi:hypothetical protein
MAPVLTLYQGEAKREFVEHPTEIARKALIAAALIETPVLADHCRRFAATLPERRAIPKGGE